MGGREVPEGRDICIRIADSLHCTKEINTTLYSIYTPIKNKRGRSRGLEFKRRKRNGIH